MAAVLRRIDASPATITAFSRAGLTTLPQILCRSIPELVAQTGLKDSQVVDIVCRLSIGVAPQPATAAQLLQTEAGTITWGDPGLDAVGPLRTGQLIDLCGESSSGKSQLALQLCMAVQLPKDQGGLEARAAYINTEAPFPSRRWHQLVEHSAGRFPFLDQSTLSQNLFLEHIDTVDTFWSLLQTSLPAMLSKGGARLVVIDSIAALFRADFTYDQSAARAHVLFDIARRLKQLAHENGAVIVCINQVADRVVTDALAHRRRQVIPALGLAWSSCVNTRFFVRRVTSRSVPVQGQRIVRQLACAVSCHLPEARANFFVDTDGCHFTDEHA